MQCEIFEKIVKKRGNYLLEKVDQDPNFQEPAESFWSAPKIERALDWAVMIMNMRTH